MLSEWWKMDTFKREENAFQYYCTQQKSQKVSQLVGALSPVSHRGLHQGWFQKKITQSISCKKVSCMTFQVKKKKKSRMRLSTSLEKTDHNEQMTKNGCFLIGHNKTKGKCLARITHFKATRRSPFYKKTMEMNCNISVCVVQTFQKWQASVACENVSM